MSRPGRTPIDPALRPGDGPAGGAVNLKRIHRPWRVAGLKVPQAQRKRRRLGSSENSGTRHRAERPNHVWSYDFVMDQTSDGKRLKILTVVDESGGAEHDRRGCIVCPGGPLRAARRAGALPLG